MLYKLLFRTTLVAHFAKGSTNPLPSALIRIALGFSMAAGGGILVSNVIRHASLPTDLPTRLLVTLALLFGYLLAGFVLLASGVAQTGSLKNLIFLRTIKMMPLSQSIRWAVSTLPSLIILATIGIFGFFVINAVTIAMSVSRAWLLFGWVLGLLSGYGAMLLYYPKTFAAKGVLFAWTILTSSYLLERLLSTQTEHIQNILLWTVDALVLTNILGVIQSYKKGIRLASDSHTTNQLALIPNYIPYSAWFLVKLWRNRRTRNSLLLSICLACIGAASVWFRRRTIGDPLQLLFFGALLAATFACDVRGVMRRYIPPEMVLLRGTRGIVNAEILSVLLCGLLIGLPMFMALHSGAASQLLFAVSYATIQVFASVIGLFASTLFVPEAGDTGSQFFAATIASIAVFMLPKLAHFSNISVAAQSLRWLVAAAIVVLVIYVVEQVRRKSYGRS